MPTPAVKVKARETTFRARSRGLKRAWGKETFQTRSAALRQMPVHLDRKFDGRVSAFLDANPGILLNVPLFGHLMLHAERVKGRLR